MDKSEAFKKAKENIETRFGVPFGEYMKSPRSQEVQAKVNESLRIETEKHRSVMNTD